MDFQEEGTKVGNVGEQGKRQVIDGVEVSSVNHVYGQPMPDYAGIHLWVFVGMWSADITSNRQVFTSANMLGLTGPLCYFCGADFDPDLDVTCPGEVEIEVEEVDTDVPA